MGFGCKELTAFYNESLLPKGLRLLTNAMLMEFQREHVELMGEYLTEDHPNIRCSCGSNKVINYGIPKNNRRYFHCHTCDAFFKAPVYQREWNETYRTNINENPTYDCWLEKYAQLFTESKNALTIDLGCGYGNDTIYLQRKGFKTVSCDYAEEALRRLRHLAGVTDPVCFDMLDGLPIVSDTFKIVVANLSLHYFSWSDTERLVEEIRRVLLEGGYLLCRVNSINDVGNGAGQGNPIEDNYFEINGKHKRFFNEKQLKRLFRSWKIQHCSENSIIRFGKSKIFWEVVVCKA